MATETKTLTPLDRALRIAELRDAYYQVDTGMVDKWVELGLMTPEEFAAYEASSQVESEAYLAGQIAEEGVPRPDTTATRSPKHQAAVLLLDSLGHQAHVQERAVDALDACRSYYKSSREFAGQFYDLTEAIDALQQQLPKHNVGALASAERSVKAFARHTEEKEQMLWDAYRKAQSQANAEARLAVLAQHPDVVVAGKRAHQAKERRVQERQAAIVAQIRALLQPS